MKTNEMIDLIGFIRADLTALESCLLGQQAAENISILEPDKREDGIVSYGDGKFVKRQDSSTN